MFNPLFIFNADVLEATVKRGCTYFVRNSYNAAFDHFKPEIKAWLLITHYNDQAKAKAHYGALNNDNNRFYYDWSIPEHQERLKLATSQPEGYKIYSAYFMPDYKDKITPSIKDKINKYLYKHTDWKPGRGDTVNIDVSLQFGSLYATLSFAGQQLRAKFEDIETNK